MKFADFLKMTMDPLVYGVAGLSDILTTQYAVVLYAQAYHETGGFTSALYKDWRHNMYGMKCSISRNPIWDMCPTGSMEGVWSKGTIGQRELFQDYMRKQAAYAGFRIPFAGYSSYNLSLCDRINWDTYCGIYYTTAREYMDSVMGSNIKNMKYAEDPLYIKKWVQTLNKVCDDNNLSRIPVRGYETTGSGVIAEGSEDPPPSGTETSPSSFFLGGWDRQSIMIAGLFALAIYGMSKMR